MIYFFTASLALLLGASIYLVTDCIAERAAEWIVCGT
jgi:hypothetical protein